MKRRLCVFMVLGLLLASLAAAASPSPAQAQEDLSPWCKFLNDPVWESFGPVPSIIGITPGEMFYAGEQITISAGAPATGAPTSFSVQLDAAQVGTASFPGTVVYHIPADVSHTSIFLQAVGGDVSWDVSCTRPVAGCDLMMGISASSVVGAFVADTQAYSAPGVLTSPAVTLQTGKTAWVLGQDASSQYYKIVWVCSYLWVPKTSMGPNYDATWNGTPLPTGVVQ